MRRALIAFAALSLVSFSAAAPVRAQDAPAQPPALANPGGAAMVAAPDPGGLHPVFRLTPKEAQARLELGKQMAKAKKSQEDVMAPYAAQTKVERGPKGTAVGLVWCYGLDGNPIIWEGYRATTQYEDPRVPEAVLTKGTFQDHLTFTIVLASYPRVGESAASRASRNVVAFGNLFRALGNAPLHVPPPPDWVVLRSADADEIHALKFVLSDDQGHHYGVAVQDAAQESAKETVPGYTSASAVVDEATPYTEQHPYYVARYTVTFNLFDDRGKARIGPAVQKLILRILTPRGEQDAEFTLRKIPLPADDRPQSKPPDRPRDNSLSF